MPEVAMKNEWPRFTEICDCRFVDLSDVVGTFDFLSSLRSTLTLEGM